MLHAGVALYSHIIEKARRKERYVNNYIRDNYISELHRPTPVRKLTSKSMAPIRKMRGKSVQRTLPFKPVKRRVSPRRRSVSRGSRDTSIPRGRTMSRSTSRSRSSRSRSRRSRRLDVSGAGYGGKVYSTKSGIVNRMNAFNKTGVAQVHESLGSVTDPDCVYIVNEVVNARDCIFNMIGALLRKLLEKAGIRITGYDGSVVSLNDGRSNLTDYFIRIVTQNTVSGTQTFIDTGIFSANTFEAITGSFVQTMEEYSAGHGRFGPLNNTEMVKIMFYQIRGDNNESMLSQLFFNEVFVDIYSKSEMKVQNRTQATGGSTDAENISNNPLQGRVYMFKGIPKPKANDTVNGGTSGSSFLAERILYPKGISTFGAASLSNTWKEPPFAKMFWNCTQAGGIRLEPGQIKQFNAIGRKSGNFLKILKSIRLQMNNVVLPITNYSIFPCQMIALEDVINANAAENISITYEVQRMLGVKCYTKEKKYFRTQMFST